MIARLFLPQIVVFKKDILKNYIEAGMKFDKKTSGD
jgi:hypothetical protein